MLRSFDANGNGVIEPNEVPPERRRMLEFMAQRAGMEIGDGPIRIDKIRDAMLGRSSGDGDGSKKDKNEPDPLVPGFGTDQEVARVPGFGERIEEASGGSSDGQSSRSSSSRGSSRDSRRGSSRSGSDQERDERIKGFAQSMMKRYDRDGSGVLEKHEWGEIRGDPNEIDRDHNGKITEDEMAQRLMNYSRSRGGDRGDGRNGSSRDGASGDSGRDYSDGPASYRLRTAMEMLPEGLPPWFAEQDASGDGQVSMAEYSSYWSDQKAGEFVRLDMNGDGLITAQECLDAPAAAEVSPQPVATVGGPAPSAGTPAPAQPAAAEKAWWE